MLLNTPPPGWSVDRLNAFHDVMSAFVLWKLYKDGLADQGIVTGNLITIRNELGNHIANTLLPKLRDSL